jgi:hypothetical protein
VRFKPGANTELISPTPEKGYLEITISGAKRFSDIYNTLKKKFPYFKENSILFYLSQTFAVYPNAYLKDVYTNFGSGGVLTVTYVINEAWG